MEEEIISFKRINRQISSILGRQCTDLSEIILTKRHIQAIYTEMAGAFSNNVFYNWGIWDEKICKEYQGLNFDFSKLCNVQDIYSQLLLYYLIKPLANTRFFNKRLLDIGCGTGVGLRAASEILASKYALGIDLVIRNVRNAHNNFRQENKTHYIQSDAEHLPVKNESFDIITNLESSHLYPKIDNFFSEVERVLSPGGFFCYADLQIDQQQQYQRLEAFIKSRKNLKIIAKHDLTKLVQGSIYQRIIIGEKQLSEYAAYIFGDQVKTELPALIYMAGLMFLPWWKIRLKNPELHDLVKMARKISFWYKKNYFYYLIQKSY